MRKILHTLAALSMLLTLACKQAPDRFDLNEVRHPSATYRSMSFWSLNDSLSADEMRRQLALFKEGGFGAEAAAPIAARVIRALGSYGE